MDPGEQATGIRDEQYNLVSVLYHALQGAETIEAYVLDAEGAGDERLVAFFREAQATHRQLAERAKELLGMRGGVAPEAAGGAIPAGSAPIQTPAPPDTGRADAGGRVAPEVGLPPEGGAAPGIEPVGDVPPRSTDVQREPNIPADEFGLTAEEAPLTIDVPRTPNTTPLPDEDLIAETRGVAPEDVPRETSPERPPHDAPSARLAEDAEPGAVPEASPTRAAAGGLSRATQQQRAAEQTEGKQEDEKGLIDRVKDALTGEEPGRQRGQ